MTQRAISLAAAAAFSIFLGGCVEGDRPPDISLVQKVEWQLDFPLVFVNVTVRNVSNITLDGPDLSVVLSESPAAEKRAQLGFNFTSVTLGFWKSGADEPKEPYYHDARTGRYLGKPGATPGIIAPYEFQPNASDTFSYVMLLHNAIRTSEGHYRIDVRTLAFVDGYVVGENYDSPCFTIDGEPYYDSHPVEEKPPPKDGRLGCQITGPRRVGEQANSFALAAADRGELIGIDVGYWASQ